MLKLLAFVVALICAVPAWADYNPANPSQTIQRPINASGGSQIVSDTTTNTGAGISVSNGTDTVRSYRTALPITQYTYDTRLCFLNANWNGPLTQTGPGNSITIDAALEVGTTYVAATFNGAATFVLANGARICTDPIALDISAGSTAYARSSVTVTAGNRWPLITLGGNLSSYGNNGTDSTNGTGGLANGSEGSYVWGPVEVHGTTYPLTSDVTCIIGDSIAFGNFDLAAYTYNGSAPTGQGGYIVRALGGLLTTSPHNWLQTSVPATTAAERVQSLTNSALTAAYSGCAYAWVHLGINDLSSGATAGQLETSITTIVNYFKARGIPIAVTPLNPRTNSTDVWRSAANQSVTAYEANRTGFNDWCRAGVGGTGAVCVDAAAVTECNAANVQTVDGGRWCVVGTTPVVSSTATGGSAFNLIDTSQTWVTNAYQGLVAIVTSGTYSGQYCIIGSNTTTTLNCAYANLGGSPSGGTYVIQNTPTAEGLHPNPNTHALMAASAPLAAWIATLTGH